MKLATLLTLSGPVFGIGSERGLPERYIYENPLCESIALCSSNPGCDGKLLTDISGTISVSNYANFFGCRWEIKGGNNSKIKIKVNSGSSFGIENQSSCGFDRLHIRSADNKGYGRLCSSAADSSLPYNGMSKFETDGEIKIKSSAFRDWLLLDTNHLVIAFDSDKQKTGNGFNIEYQIIGEPLQDTIETVGDSLEANLHIFLTEVSDKVGHQGRLADHLTRLFTRFDSRMAKCKNGDQSEELHSQISHSVFDINDIEKVENAWMGFFRTAFNNCELPITKNGDFDTTSWPRRIERWFTKLQKHLTR